MLVKESTRKIFVIVTVAMLSFTFSGCETVKGAGRDIENAGEAIEDAAD